jgi:hypothetical protein
MNSDRCAGRASARSGIVCAVPSLRLMRVFENASGDWWAKCERCKDWVSASNGTRREAEQSAGRHIEQVHSGEPAGWSTPEEAALSGYSPGAAARVASVEMIDEHHAIVTVDTVPSHRMACDCRRDRDGLWREWSAGH